MQGVNPADFHLACKGTFNAVSQIGGKAQAHPTVGTDVTWNRNQLMGHLCFFQELFCPKGMVNRFENNDMICFIILHGAINLPASAKAEAISYIFEIKPTPSSSVMPK